MWMLFAILQKTSVLRLNELKMQWIRFTVLWGVNSSIFYQMTNINKLHMWEFSLETSLKWACNVLPNMTTIYCWLVWHSLYVVFQFHVLFFYSSVQVGFKLTMSSFSVWLSWIKFELSKNKPMAAAELVCRAEATLEEHLVTQFVTLKHMHNIGLQ